MINTAPYFNRPFTRAIAGLGIAASLLLSGCSSDPKQFDRTVVQTDNEPEPNIHSGDDPSDRLDIADSDFGDARYYQRPQVSSQARISGDIKHAKIPGFTFKTDDEYDEYPSEITVYCDSHEADKNGRLLIDVTTETDGPTANEMYIQKVRSQACDDETITRADWPVVIRELDLHFEDSISHKLAKD